MEWTRLENESDEHLLMRLAVHKDEIGTWDDLADIMNELTGDNATESKYRKRFKKYRELGLVDEFLEPNDYKKTQISENSFDDKLRELEQAKIQYRDERNAWNRQNYLEARVCRDLDYLGEKLSQIGRINFTSSPPSSPIVNSDNDLIVCLSDLHIGQTFDSWFGQYNSDIAKDRLNEYLNEVIRIGKIHNSECIYVLCCGDQISGNIHLSIQVSNRENLIEQVKLSSEYIASFCVELSKHFNKVYVVGISGNHSRIVSNKDKDIKDERLDDLITWIVGKITSHISNITVLDNNIDTGIAPIYVRNKMYTVVHGDNDFMTDSGISRLVMALGIFPYAIIGGHRHTPAYKEFNNVKYIQSGSLTGTGDDHTIKCRLAGKANQTVLVCNEKGIECIYNVELS